MKIIVSATGNSGDSDVSSVFGRCPYFLVITMDDGAIQNIEPIENTSAEQKGGAGISAARTVVEKGAEIVISENIGPRAMDVLNQFSVLAYKAKGTIKQALSDLSEEKLKRIE